MTDAHHWDPFVVFKLPSEVAWLDPQTFRARYQLTLPSHCHEMIVDDSRERCYVSIYGDGIYGDGIYGNNTDAAHHLAVIDLRTHTLTSIVDGAMRRATAISVPRLAEPTTATTSPIIGDIVWQGEPAP